MPSNERTPPPPTPDDSAGGYAYDLFISYAAKDDEQSGTGAWVSHFVTRLKSTLERRKGREARVWVDRTLRMRGADGMAAWNKMEAKKALRSSALLVPILSPAFVNSDFCLEELNAFVEFAGPTRVLSVLKEPCDLPQAVSNILPFVFFESVGRGSRELVDQPYWAALNQFVSQVGVLLTSLSKSAPAAAPRQQKMEVFLCHSSGDKPAVRSLWAKLTSDGFAPWLDEKELLPGQRWESEIRDAIDRAGAIVVVLSNGSVNKEGYLQREIRMVLDKASEIPEGAIFLIPAKVEECSVPRRLSDLQWVNLFENEGYSRLRQALQMRASSLSGRLSLSDPHFR